MLTIFMLLTVAGGLVHLVLQWLLRECWEITIGVPKALAAALVVLTRLTEFLRPFPFPVPLGITIGLLLPDLLVRRG